MAEETDAAAVDRLVARRKAGTIGRPDFVRQVMAIVGLYDGVTRSVWYGSIEKAIGEQVEEFWGPSWLSDELQRRRRGASRRRLVKDVRRAVADEIAKPSVLARPGADQLLTMADVERLTKRSRTTIWTLRQEGRFPRGQPLRPGARAIRFLKSEVERWVAGERDWGGEARTTS